MDQQKPVFHFSEDTIQRAMAHLEEYADGIARDAEIRGCWIATTERDLLHSFIFNAPTHARAQALHDIIEARRMKKEKTIGIGALTDSTSDIAMRFVDSAPIKDFEVPPADPRIQETMQKIAPKQDSVENLREKLEDAYNAFLKEFKEQIKAEELKKGQSTDIGPVPSIFEEVVFTYIPTNDAPPQEITLRWAKIILDPRKNNFCKHYLQAIIDWLPRK